MSFPTRERGLKYWPDMGQQADCRRSPRGNVDWNSLYHWSLYHMAWSFPTRERGLKWCWEWKNRGDYMSFPTRERGLKFDRRFNSKNSVRRSPRGNVDWNVNVNIDYLSRFGRSPRGNVDWNWKQRWMAEKISRRSPRGNVDWNWLVRTHRRWYNVVPHAGTWIEINSDNYSESYVWSFPTRERGLKLFEDWQSIPAECRSPRGNVDWNSINQNVPIYIFCRSPRGNVDWN